MKTGTACSVTDCPSSYCARGYCSRHYSQMRKHGRILPEPPTLTERFWQKVQKGGAADCWVWRGPTNKHGYGRFVAWEAGVPTHWYAHRFVMTLRGEEFAENAVVLHECDNPPCVNPSHLRVGTQADNMRDAKEKGRMNLSGLALGRLSNNRPRKVRPA